MRCKKCGKKLKRNEKFCNSCGYYNGPKNEMNWDKNNKDDLDLEDYQEEESFDLKEDASGTKEDEFYYENEELLEAFIGEDYKIIKKMPFNVYAFLLNWLYVLYRKLYITGGIGLLITLIVIVFFRDILLIYIGITMIVLGFLFNKYYIMVGKYKIERLLKKYDGTDKFALAEICRDKGGVNVVFALIIYFIFLVIVILSLYNFDFEVYNHPKYWQEDSDHLATCTSIVKVAYNDLENRKVSMNIEDAVCKKTDPNKENYEAYLKVKDGKRKVYAYYETTTKGLVYKEDTNGIEELELKSVNKTITKEEQVKLNSMKQLDDAYIEIKKAAKKEDDLIDKKKNTKEKANFLLTREEIIR